MSKLVGKFIVDQDRVYKIEELLPDGRVYARVYVVVLCSDMASIEDCADMVLPIPDGTYIRQTDREAFGVATANEIRRVKGDNGYDKNKIRRIRTALVRAGACVML